MKVLAVMYRREKIDSIFLGNEPDFKSQSPYHEKGWATRKIADIPTRLAPRRASYPLPPISENFTSHKGQIFPNNIKISTLKNHSFNFHLSIKILQHLKYGKCRTHNTFCAISYDSMNISSYEHMHTIYVFLFTSTHVKILSNKKTFVNIIYHHENPGKKM